MEAQGRAFVYGDNVDTDVIIPARYLNTTDHAELASHCMEDIDVAFAKSVEKGDVIVAGRNFGCGSSREHAPIAIKASGVSCVVASSFARIFYRNAINIGLPILELADADKLAKKGDRIRVDFDSGLVENLTTGAKGKAKGFPPFMQGIMRAGGLIEYVRARLESESGAGHFASDTQSASAGHFASEGKR
jgi:3-isopropylmalate/(R)-2-methylmalate dehydratase small subunit